jgi:Flp pilus assembly protein TadG
MNIITTTSLLSTRCVHILGQRKQRGVVAIEFALVFLFGMLPLLLITLAGVLVFAAKQSLTLAASNGARAALHYSTSAGSNLTDACSTALQSMSWLFALSNNGTSTPATCTGGSISNTIASIEVTHDCTAASGATCVKVTTSYDYDNSPLILGTGKVYGWLMHKPIESKAVIQVYNTQGS